MTLGNKIYVLMNVRSSFLTLVLLSRRPCLQSQGHHDHGEPAETNDVDLVEKFDGVWKGLTALAGIYLLFIIEHCIGMFKHYKDHGVK